MAEMGAAVPAEMADRLERAGDAESVRRMGTEMATGLCQQLLDAGAPGLHFYTLNRSLATREIYANLGLAAAALHRVAGMRSAVCDLLGIDFPLLAFSHCRDVVAAVTNAGGFGVLGASSHSPEQLDVELRWIDEHTGGRPYGADILVPARVVGRGEDLPAPIWPPWCPTPIAVRGGAARGAWSGCGPRGRGGAPAPAGSAGSTRRRN